MADLKELVGEEIFNTHIAPKIGERKVIVAEKDGDYVPYNRFKEINDSNKSLSKQIEERDKQLEELKKSAGANAELTAKIKELEDINKQAAAQYAQALYQRDFDSALEKLLDESGSIDNIAVKAHLKMDDIKLDEGKLTGALEQLTALKNENKHLFKAAEPAPQLKVGGKVISQPQKLSGDDRALEKSKPWNAVRRFGN